ncbi:YqzE family protein [Halalkalibacter krulwichiae]|uniref:YqzE-like protein n=1 Tax=Halalkalibacter krulwichiae TaxID=199441 RepID=A0A1X9MDC5_9BACI|nr:YqzE family protein [Halalkalibacter krulwichiae]ARK31428.1 hypothetical protein BkAM31D_17070 [Halalkalibacter krulwichiae]
MSSFNDYVKFLTQQAVIRMDQPKEERKSKREERRAEKQSFPTQAFGIIPMGLSLFWKSRKSNKK